MDEVEQFEMEKMIEMVRGMERVHRQSLYLHWFSAGLLAGMAVVFGILVGVYLLGFAEGG